MDHAPRRPRRSNRKAVCFNPNVRVRIVKPLTLKAKRSDLWVSREDLKQKREEFYGILDCLTLDSSFYEEGGYFLLGLDSKKDQELKYRNMVDSRYAVLKEQRQQSANSRWHCGVGSSKVTDYISQSYQEHTAEASKVARYTAMRLEEELNAQEKPDSEIMSLHEVQSLLQRSNSRLALSMSSRTNSFNDVMDIWISDANFNADSSGDDWSVGYDSTDDDDDEEEDIFGEVSMEVPIREIDKRSSLKRVSYHSHDPVDETHSTDAASDWSADISTDNDDDFLAETPAEESPAISSSLSTSSHKNNSYLTKQASPQGSDIFVPTFTHRPLPTNPPLRDNAIAA